MLCKRTSKNQITLSKKLLGAINNPEYFEESLRGNEIVLTPVQISPILKKNKLSEIRNKIQSLGLTDADIQKAVVWARRK